jgi:predicted ATPase
LRHRAGLRRATRAVELCDGTRRFLHPAAAFLTPGPPRFLVLNEPKTVQNSTVIEPLPELVRTAADNSQVMLTTHSYLVADRLQLE